MRFSVFTAIITALVGAIVQATPQNFLNYDNVPPGHAKYPVPFGPKPTGCSDFELVIGEFPFPTASCWRNNKSCGTYDWIYVARGTNETGPFGWVVGDPLVAGVGKQMNGTRGYAVQVGALCH